MLKSIHSYYSREQCSDNGVREALIKHLPTIEPTLADIFREHYFLTSLVPAFCSHGCSHNTDIVDTTFESIYLMKVNYAFN